VTEDEVPANGIVIFAWMARHNTIIEEIPDAARTLEHVERRPAHEQRAGWQVRELTFKTLNKTKTCNTNR